MKAIFFLIGFYSNLSIAQTVEVQQLDENLDIHKLKTDGVKVKTVSELDQHFPKQSLPKRSEVLSFIKQLETNDQIKAMDVLDQDLLYMRAHKMSIQELQKSYPHFSNSMISKIKSIASKDK